MDHHNHCHRQNQVDYNRMYLNHYNWHHLHRHHHHQVMRNFPMQYGQVCLLSWSGITNFHWSELDKICPTNINSPKMNNLNSCTTGCWLNFRSWTDCLSYEEIRRKRRQVPKCFHKTSSPTLLISIASVAWRRKKLRFSSVLSQRRNIFPSQMNRVRVGQGHVMFYVIHRNELRSWQEAEEDSEDASDLDEELFNDPDTQEIIRNLVL